MSFNAHWPANMGNVYTVEFVPTDINGHQIFSGSSHSGPNGTDGNWLLSITGVPASKLTGIALHLRHYDQAVQFRDVSLMPGTMTNVQISIAPSTPSAAVQSIVTRSVRTAPVTER